MAEARTINNYSDSISDFLNRNGEFAPISSKKLEVIMSTVAAYVADSKDCDPAEQTETLLTKADLKTRAVANPSGINISGKVQEILEEPDQLDKNNYFQSLQQWLGHVIEIDNKEGLFKAKLQDLNNSGTYEMAEFEIRDIADGDLEIFKVGAAFYWSLGYHYNRSQKTKESSIRFQRLNDWTEEEYNTAIDNADDLFQFFSK